MTAVRSVLVVALDPVERRELLLALGQRQRLLPSDALLPPALAALTEVLTDLDRVRKGQAGSAPRFALDALAAQGDDRHVLIPLTVSFDGAAAALGVSQSTLKRLVRSGEMPTVKVAGRRLVRHADLTAYVDRLPATTTTGAADGGGPPGAPHEKVAAAEAERARAVQPADMAKEIGDDG